MKTSAHSSKDTYGKIMPSQTFRDCGSGVGCSQIIPHAIAKDVSGLASDGNAE